MSLPTAPPAYRSWAEMMAPIRYGVSGWPVYALKVTLNSIRFAEPTAVWDRLVPDGVFDDATDVAVRSFQRWAKIGVDAIVGPVTQTQLIAWCVGRSHEVQPDVPKGLAQGIAMSEGAGILAATNTQVEGGVDCGPAQWRVYGPPYDAARLARAFNPLRALMDAGADLVARADVFRQGAWVKAQPLERRRELSIRIAAMAHNWPTAGGADRIAETGKCSSPDVACSWLPRDDNGLSLVRFPDGVRVQTRWDWCQRYAMGAPLHGEPGQLVRFVTDWS